MMANLVESRIFLDNMILKPVINSSYLDTVLHMINKLMLINLLEQQKVSEFNPAFVQCHRGIKLYYILTSLFANVLMFCQCKGKEIKRGVKLTILEKS